MTTVHSTTATQKLSTGRHIRTGGVDVLLELTSTTGAATAVGMVIPSLKDKLTSVHKLYLIQV